ncbi:MAG: FAD-dependent oxidoreductase [Longimicrobiales bacterium]
MAPPPNRVAIIGAGPAGFFTAEALLKQDVSVEIDIYDELPTPFGLVRYGVAPDHAAIKSVTKVYEKLLKQDEVRYLGNVELGTDIHVEELRDRYDQIVYAFGCQSDRSLGIPGEDLDGSWAATTFVGWYNGHPDYEEADFELGSDHVVVVGNGNVAIDVARILVLDREALAKTDIADHALASLKTAKVTKVTLLGRRGPAQAAFTNPELKEFGRLEGVSPLVDPAQLKLDEATEAKVQEDRGRTRNMATLREFAAKEPDSGSRVVHFDFFTSPVEILGQDGRVSGVCVERNELALDEDGTMRPRGTGETRVLECGMVLRSVGYRGEPVPGVPYEPKRGIVRNVEGRVVDERGNVLRGEYVVGWAKRGPSGVIGTNKADASGTVGLMMEDWEAGDVLTPAAGATDARQLLDERDVQWIDEEGWARLDAFETDQGEADGRPRVKVCSVPEMLKVIQR